MKIRPFVMMLAACTLGSCFSPSRIIISEKAAYSGPPTIKRIRADGDTLRIALEQDSAPAWVSSIQAQVIEGDVYLRTSHISSPVHATDFSVDLSGPKFPSDWRNRLYWIQSDSISSPINPFINHRREIVRSKITLEKQHAQQGAGGNGGPAR